MPEATDGEAFLRWEFETYAIAKSGPDKGKIYGGISWGFEADSLARVTSLARSFIKTPTAEFKAAVAQWDAQANGPASGRTTSDQAPLGPVITFP